MAVRRISDTDPTSWSLGLELSTSDHPKPGNMTKVRSVLFVFLGLAGLVLKRHYSGSLEEVIHSYAGNFSVSFAVYFVVMYVPFHSRLKELLTAGLALGAVELFEACDGFGVMRNVYDPFDFLANFLGVACALTVDVALRRRARAPMKA